MLGVPSKSKASAATAVRVRRAYFDCRFGQLHVRTAFSPNGGFDEHTTLICLHGAGSTGRVFDAFMTFMAADRSVYSPDLPGCGESDPLPGSGVAAPGSVSISQAVAAIGDFIDSMQFSKVDLIGCAEGIQVVGELAKLKPEKVRKRFEVQGQALQLLASEPQAFAKRVREVLG